MSQKYDTSLGLQGNIERALNLIHTNYNNLAIEQCDRTNADTSNRESVEQNHTDDYLNLVEAQQKITDLELRLIALERKNI